MPVTLQFLKQTNQTCTIWNLSWMSGECYRGYVFCVPPYRRNRPMKQPKFVGSSFWRSQLLGSWLRYPYRIEALLEAASVAVTTCSVYLCSKYFQQMTAENGFGDPSEHLWLCQIPDVFSTCMDTVRKAWWGSCALLPLFVFTIRWNHMPYLNNTILLFHLCLVCVVTVNQ